ncbi:hypothetical protein EDB83DRAFT_2334250 [Lactarius deliciosus]|nr:hypothetical protein EDB83DRAFT_2334250 [Lactarius deliciosus]
MRGYTAVVFGRNDNVRSLVLRIWVMLLHSGLCFVRCWRIFEASQQAHPHDLWFRDLYTIWTIAFGAGDAVQ